MSSHHPIQFNTIGGGYAIASFIQIAHALHQGVHVAVAVPAVEPLRECCDLLQGRLRVMVRESEGAEQVLKFDGTLDGIVIPVCDKGKFVESQTD